MIRKAADQRRAVCLVQDTLNDLRKTTDPARTISKLRAELDKITPASTSVRADRGGAVSAVSNRHTAELPSAITLAAAARAIGCDPSFVALPLLAAWPVRSATSE